jgi:hypothetical protein
LHSIVFNNVAELATNVAARFDTPAVIGVDGWPDAGKSTLAEKLAFATGGSWFDLDNALVRDQGVFVSALRIDCISNWLATIDGYGFISGVCLRQVLDIAGFDAKAHIYVKRMASWGWADEDELCGNVLSSVFGSSGGDALRREMRDYHEQWQPHINADYEFHRLG